MEKEIQPRSNSDPLSELFSSKSRVKIIELLAISGEMNISGIIRKTGLNYRSAIFHLTALERFNLVQKKQYGRIRIYRYNIENQKARAVKKIIDLLHE